jgi:L-iditol 2-dehydrogenase
MCHSFGSAVVSPACWSGRSAPGFSALVVLALERMGIVDLPAMRAGRKYVYFALAILAAVVTPADIIDASEADVVERVMELTGGRGADVVITATSANVTQEQAISMAARNGRISFFGGLPKTDATITCDSNVVHYRQLHIHGANGSAPEHNRRALEYISTGQVPVRDLITAHVPLDRVLDAFELVRTGTAIKVTVEP